MRYTVIIKTHLTDNGVMSCYMTRNELLQIAIMSRRLMFQIMAILLWASNVMTHMMKS